MGALNWKSAVLGELLPEEILLLQVRADNLPEPKREYRWAAHFAGGPGKGVRGRLARAGLRDWRFDFAWPAQGLALEVEGGTWTRGRHVRGQGYAEDCIKYNEAQLRGWIVLRFTTEQVKEGLAVEVLARALLRRPE